MGEYVCDTRALLTLPGGDLPGPLRPAFRPGPDARFLLQTVRRVPASDPAKLAAFAAIGLVPVDGVPTKARVWGLTWTVDPAGRLTVGQRSFAIGKDEAWTSLVREDGAQFADEPPHPPKPTAAPVNPIPLPPSLAASLGVPLSIMGEGRPVAALWRVARLYAAKGHAYAEGPLSAVNAHGPKVAGALVVRADTGDTERMDYRIDYAQGRLEGVETGPWYRETHWRRIDRRAADRRERAEWTRVGRMSSDGPFDPFFVESRLARPERPLRVAGTGWRLALTKVDEDERTFRLVRGAQTVEGTWALTDRLLALAPSSMPIAPLRFRFVVAEDSVKPTPETCVTLSRISAAK